MFAPKNRSVRKAAQAKFDKLGKLDVRTVDGRAERKRMADSYYHKDALPTAGKLWNPKGKHYAS